MRRGGWCGPYRLRRPVPPGERWSTSVSPEGRTLFVRKCTRHDISKKNLSLGCLNPRTFFLSAWSYGGLDLADALVLFGLCFACELVDSGLGMDYGTLLSPTLLMLGYQPQDIVPTTWFSELLSGFTASFFHNEIKNVELGARGKDFCPAVILAAGSLHLSIRGRPFPLPRWIHQFADIYSDVCRGIAFRAMLRIRSQQGE